MATCFVIQPFDGGAFDKRFKDVISPAIIEAGLEPYRVDEDPSVEIPIDDIEKGIRESSICLADITTDNPNIWYELGFAFACRKSVVLICSKERRDKFPFDIQHRHVIRYSVESSSDFVELKKKIVERVTALLAKDSSLRQISSSELAPVEGLNQQEMAVIVSVAGNLYTPEDHISAHVLRRDIEKAGFTQMAAILGIKTLSQRGFLDHDLYEDNDRDQYHGYNLTEKGWKWITDNQHLFNIKKEKEDDSPF